MSRWGSSIWRLVVDFVCPPTCLACGQSIQAGGCLCASCFSALHLIVAPCCQRCGEPLSVYEVTDDGQGVCAACQQDPPLWQQARAAFVYNDMARRLIFPLKYSDRPGHAAFLATFMEEAARELFQPGVVVIPVPLHIKKLRKRRYNQAGLLAFHLAKKQHANVLFDGLYRRQNTRSLAHLPVSERKEELHNMFGVKPCYHARLKGKHVVLVDDILTTGATAEACSRALLDIGCSKVDIIVAARACAGHTVLT
ncbi:double zinc ribbon domain-containing protein [Saccharibacter floricola]|uniref:double zinc ribbon domain-containing protein n=1 Tax=Saccharibacter floricola TaxID=231053 RepID=UPI000477A6A1